MDAPRSRVEPEAEESDFARRSLERHRVVVRHGDVERSTVEMLRPARAADGTVVLGAAVALPLNLKHDAFGDIFCP